MIGVIKMGNLTKTKMDIKPQTLQAFMTAGLKLIHDCVKHYGTNVRGGIRC
jgi:hypothetical protein